MSENIKRFPRRFRDTKRLDARKGKLRCEVSDRWIKFPDKVYRQGTEEFLHLDIMTLGADDKDRKLCEIVVDRTELLKILDQLPVKEI